MSKIPCTSSFEESSGDLSDDSEDDSDDDEEEIQEDFLPLPPILPPDLDVEDPLVIDDWGFSAIATSVYQYAEDVLRKVWMNISWTVCHFHTLPQWLQDNDYILHGYRPPLQSFKRCLHSIFSVHTETGNIWTHLLGCIAFFGVGVFFLSYPTPELSHVDKAVFAAFFIGACFCLGLSAAFHTFLCHSEKAGRLFSKLDYCGISLLITGSFVPWLYYSFYCNFYQKIVYLSVVLVLGLTTVIVSLWPRFGEPKFRFLRAGNFLAFGLSGLVPAFHYAFSNSWALAVSQAGMQWLILMGSLYVIGTMFYALRIPERFWPGKFDIWFQSHQIFHCFVVAAAFVHYHGITEMVQYRVSVGECQFL
ncbi:adiponectin receptor protein-like isoform X2 [Artemia franciscana]|uniref:Adiponectin receptor n=1 Tax=Artemia franciscana TaxID=6661 RepID=A0AA88IM79_ARTSF|nr:hypothetical protein QYM36_000989 [Artemia franciscana]